MVTKIANTVGSLRDGLDRDGCAYGQVTRERTDNLVDQVTRLEARINYVVAAVTLQLLGFVFAVILFVLGHVRVG